MKKNIFQLLFLIITGIHIGSIFFGNTLFSSLSKPLIVSSLLCFFLSCKPLLYANVGHLIIAALSCSVIGDVLLLFENKNPNYFIFGLLSFLMAHIFYSISFFKILKKAQAKIRWSLLPIVACYYCFLLYLLYPTLGSLRLPVIIYGGVISSMFFIALQLAYIRHVSILITIGATFFVLSDTLLAINKFYMPFYQASVLIMITYCLAQYCIVKGIINSAFNIQQQTTSI